MSLVGLRAPPALEKAKVTRVAADGSLQTIRLGELWSEAPTLIVFLRHLACPGCSEELSLLAPHLAELSDLGVRVALVTSAAPERLGVFSERMKLDGGHAELFSDASLAVYRAAGFAQSAWKTYGPASVAASLRLYALGHGAPRSPDDGDITQQGGAVLVEQGGPVLLHHRAADLSDHTPYAAVMDAALSLAAGRATGFA